MAPEPLGAYPALTGLRGLAAAWVMIFHAWGASEPRLMPVPLFGTDIDFTWFFASGWVGVDIFFTLSAFLLALPFAYAAATQTAQPRLADYLRRRCLRILPAYYLQLALVLGATFLLEGRLALAPRELGAHLLLWLNIGPEPVTPLVAVTWTLPIEFGFYLLLPLLVPLLTPRRAFLLLAGAIVSTFAYRYGMFLTIADSSVAEKVRLLEQLPGRLDQFALGAVTAVWVANRTDLGRALGLVQTRALTVFGLGLFAVMFVLMYYNQMQYFDGHPLLFSFHLGISVAIAALILALCSDQNRDLRVLASRPMVFLGTISYSFYLWHQVIQQWLMKQPWLDHWSPYPLPALLLVGGSLTIVVAWLSWRFVEAPALALGRSGFRSV